MLARSTWWLLGVIAAAAALAMALGLLHGGLGHVLRAPDGATSPPAVPRLPRQRPPRRLAALPGSTAARSRVPLPNELRSGLSGAAKSLAAAGVALALALAFLAVLRARARAGRTYVRMRVAPYRTDRATAEAVVSMFESLHKCISGPWWERLVAGQPSLGLEIHHSGVRQGAWFAVTCPTARVDSVLSSLRGAYPNCRLSDPVSRPGFAPCVLRLKKHATFIRRSKLIDIFEHDREPAVERLLTAMAAAGGHVFLQIALTPAPSAFESYAKTLFRMRENEGTQEGASRAGRRRSMVEQAELTGALDLQHRPLFFADLRVVAGDIHACRRVAAELRSQEAENRLVERTTGLRHGLMGLYRRRIQRGEGNPIPSFMRNVFASTELAQLWHLPSPAYSIIPIARASLPVAPAPPAIMRPRIGVLRDELGPVSIHPSMRRQNVAVPGAVEQGKSSFLVASFAEDLRRERCAVILLDPKGDAADAALSIVPTDRTCTLLDFAGPTCGFNPLAVEAPADVIADYVVGALRNLFDDGNVILLA